MGLKSNRYLLSFLFKVPTPPKSEIGDFLPGCIVAPTRRGYLLSWATLTAKSDVEIYCSVFTFLFVIQVKNVLHFVKILVVAPSPNAHVLLFTFLTSMKEWNVSNAEIKCLKILFFFLLHQLPNKFFLRKCRINCHITVKRIFINASLNHSNTLKILVLY